MYVYISDRVTDCSTHTLGATGRRFHAQDVNARFQHCALYRNCGKRPPLSPSLSHSNNRAAILAPRVYTHAYAHRHARVGAARIYEYSELARASRERASNAVITPGIMARRTLGAPLYRHRRCVPTHYTPEM